MKSKRYFLTFLLALFCIFVIEKMDANAAGGNLVPLPEGYTFYAKTTAPVYLVPDMNSEIIASVAIDTCLDVTGFLDTGFFIIGKGTPLYIPGAFVRFSSNTLSPTEAYIQQLHKISNAYQMLLETNRNTTDKFGLKDITGDGIPELISANGHEVYSYYNERPVMIYYSDMDMTYYYAKKEKLLASQYNYYGSEAWQILTLSKTILPWGQLVSICPDLSIYKKEQFTKVECNYINDATTRQNLYETLYSLAIAGSL